MQNRFVSLMALIAALFATPSFAQTTAEQSTTTQKTVVHKYQKLAARAAQWTDENGVSVDSATTKTLDKSTRGHYAAGTWVNEQGVAFYNKGDHAYTWSPATRTWGDETKAPVTRSISDKLTRNVGKSPDDHRWYTVEGGFSAGPNDISQAHDYARPVGSPDDPKLSTGWTGPKGDRTVQVHDYYRTTKSGKVVHVHGYYRSKGH